MGEIEHAGTSKTMPAITEDTAVNHAESEPVPRARASQQSDAVTVPRTRTSEDGDEAVGEIEAEVTNRTQFPAGADKIAAERGIRRITKPPID